ncbi:MAG TPA: DUF2130 domain-containing protein [Thermoanaerobaculia bacterium]|nr:DUF2130 domain-containing protein [Thermoanaerobaculia bacterium]
MGAATEKCPWCGCVISHRKFMEIQARLEKEVARRFAAEQQTLSKERQALEAERVKVKRELELAKKEADKQRLKDIADIRAILQKDRDEALLKKDAQFAREREAWQKKISEMTRRLEKKTSVELAEGADLNLFDELRAAFPEDHVTRVAKGKAGGALLHDVRYRGKSVGRIIIDGRPRNAWQHSFVTRLRQDQTEVAADHAILATAVFPAGKRELFVESGVIVVAPARVTVVMDMLRKALIAMYAARVGETERNDKLGRLYKFMTSPAFKRKLAEAEALTSEALELDVEEKRAHDNVWKKRGAVMSRIKHVLRDIDVSVSAIVEAKEDEPASDMGLLALRSPSSRVH